MSVHPTRKAETEQHETHHVKYHETQMLNSCSEQEVPAQQKVRENLELVLQKWHEEPQENCQLMPDTTEENICKEKFINFDY